MRLAALLFATALPAWAAAATHHPHAHRGDAPTAIGRFTDWEAASHIEGGEKLCYVFTRAEAPVARVPGRGDVVLTVTRRGQAHDAVALSAGFPLAGHEDAVLLAGSTRLLFYIAGRSAFARDGAAVVAAFGREGSVAARLPGPRGEVADRFGLKGFSAAYAAMLTACAPPMVSPVPAGASQAVR